jgi:hypothetical protein
MFRGPGHALAAALIAAEIVLAVAWLRLPSSRGRTSRAIATAALLAAIVVGAILRERLRLPVLDEARPRVLAASGLWLFLFFLVANTALIAWCVRAARKHLT